MIEFKYNPTLAATSFNLDIKNVGDKEITLLRLSVKDTHYTASFFGTPIELVKLNPGDTFTTLVVFQADSQQISLLSQINYANIHLEYI